MTRYGYNQSPKSSTHPLDGVLGLGKGKPALCHSYGKKLLLIGTNGTCFGLCEFLMIKIQHCSNWIMFDLFKSPSHMTYGAEVGRYIRAYALPLEVTPEATTPIEHVIPFSFVVL